MSEKRVGLVGLGSMGFGMAQSLIRAGLPTYGFDIEPQRVARLRTEGALQGELSEVASDLDILVVVVVNAEQAEAVLFGDPGIVRRLRQGAVVVNSPTVAPEYAQATETRLRELGILYLDAPISGGSLKAAAGKLTVMASGSAEAFAAARPALDAMAETIFELGDGAGPGSAMKMVNQLLAGVHIAAAAEAITFGMTQGVEPAKTVEIIAKCAGASWMFENRGPHIASGDYTPHSAVDIFVKDLGLVGDVARASKFAAPLAAAALQQFIAASASGFGREDDSAVAKIYARNAGLTLPGAQ